MNDNVEIGKRLKQVRQAKSLVIDQVSELAGLSRAYISQVENGKASPSLEVLRKLATALDVPMASLFVDDEFTVEVTRYDQRQVLQFGVDVAPPSESRLIHMLSSVEGAELEILIIEIPAGDMASPIDPGHEGEEAFLVMEGLVKTTIGTESFELKEGDSIHWNATLPHSTINAGRKKAKILFVRSPASYKRLRFLKGDGST